jgi:hypothetical protein
VNISQLTEILHVICRNCWIARGVSLDWINTKCHWFCFTFIGGPKLSRSAIYRCHFYWRLFSLSWSSHISICWRLMQFVGGKGTANKWLFSYSGISLDWITYWTLNNLTSDYNIIFSPKNFKSETNLKTYYRGMKEYNKTNLFIRVFLTCARLHRISTY